MSWLGSETSMALGSGKRFEMEGAQVVLHSDGEICTKVRDLLQSEIFAQVLKNYCEHLQAHQSPLVEPLLSAETDTENWHWTLNLLRVLASIPLEQAAEIMPAASVFLASSNRHLLHEFVEEFYNYWRSLDRYMVLHSEPGPVSFDRRPYRAFNYTIETLEDVVRAAYRDVCENITGDHPRIFRRVSAGCKVGLIAVPRQSTMPKEYLAVLDGISFIRQVWIAPPLILDPPMNKRTGQFDRVDENPIADLQLDRTQWLCYPAQVGPLVIFIYFHRCFIGLGSTLANLFELANDEQIKKGPDAIYLYGADAAHLSRYGDLPTVFFDDERNGLLAAAVPGEPRFGYFGYLKKMTLTLHNIVMMKRGRMPFHGAMVRICLRNGKSANVLIIGDTATGKSESLEAFRLMSGEMLRELRIVADDMGSLEVDSNGEVRAFGTETGAFIRLDDLQQGYAFQQIDRAVIMSPQKINARVVLPVTTLEEVLRGYPVDFVLYANNYEQVGKSHPVLDRFESADAALEVFREGAAMAKGTTTSEGLVHSYFANIFGPPQYTELHDRLAEKVFASAFSRGVYVGQIRTQLGIPGCESSGPIEVAKALFDAISARG